MERWERLPGGSGPFLALRRLMFCVFVYL